MSRELPGNFSYFLKNALKDCDDGYEYASELNRILNSHDFQSILTQKEIEVLREYAEKAKIVGEINYYTEEKIKDIEIEVFGTRGILGYLKVTTPTSKPEWPF